MQEKLRDLRDERKLRLEDVAAATGIPKSTLSRIETTENRLHRNVAIDDLGLTDAAVATLKERKLNNRLVSELLSHPTAPQLFSAMEVYIDRKSCRR